jgi:hypothetical protein
MTISSAHLQAKRATMTGDKYQKERLTRAIDLLDELISRVGKPQTQRLQVWTTADSTTNLAYVLIKKYVGDVKSLKCKLEASRNDLQAAIEEHHEFSNDTFNTLMLIESAAQAVVEESNSSLIDIE